MKTPHTTILLALLAIGLVSWSAPLRADSAEDAVMAGPETAEWNRGIAPEARLEARDLFREGNRLFKIPVYTRAADKYVAALGKWKHPAFYFNLAITQLNLGQDLEARASLELALKHGEQPLGTERYQEARRQLKEVEGLLGRLRISCPTDGAEVTLDGEPLFTGPGSREQWVKATAHQITAKRDEYVTQAKRISVPPGKLATLDLPLTKLVEDRPWAVWKPWAVIGSGVAIAATGGVLHALSAKNFTAYDDGFVKLACAEKGCSDQEIRDMNPHLLPVLDRARLEQRLAVGGYILGGALIATGAVLLYLNQPHLTEQGSAPRSVTSVAIVPAVSAATLGVVVTVSH